MLDVKRKVDVQAVIFFASRRDTNPVCQYAWTPAQVAATASS